MMSLMTIPMLAENDTSSINLCIEDTKYDVQIQTPEGWRETKDFNAAIPDTFELEGRVFHGLKFKNGEERHGCAVFFASKPDEATVFKDGLIQAQAKAQEVAFPGTKVSRLTIPKATLTGGGFEKNLANEVIKLNAKGILQGHFSREDGKSSNLTITGVVEGETSDNCLLGTAKIVSDDAMPFYGTTGVVLHNDYQLIIVSWGLEEKAQLDVANHFLHATRIVAKTPLETPKTKPAADQEVVLQRTTEIYVVTVIEEAVNIIPVSDSTVTATEAAPAAVEEAVKTASDATVAVTETAPVVVEEAVKTASDSTITAVETAPAVVEEAAKTTSDSAVAATESAPAVVEEAAKTVSDSAVAATEAAPAAVEEAVKTAPEAVLTSTEPVTTAETAA
jgi:hypothetical protein